MSLYLKENELGYAADWLGFPSISGCMAIVAVTPTGLFGLHNFGGSAPGEWAVRANRFGAFVRGHVGRGVVSRLYGVAYVQDNRGYGQHTNAAVRKVQGVFNQTQQRRRWRGELKAFATAIGFSGPIRGHDLCTSLQIAPAYVELRRNGPKCEIWVKPWTHNIPVIKGAAVNPADHMASRPAAVGGGSVTALRTTPIQMIPRDGLQRVHSTRLRG